MITKTISRFILLSILSIITTTVSAQKEVDVNGQMTEYPEWAIATLDIATQNLTIMEYWTRPEQIPDGNLYYRIASRNTEDHVQFQDTKYGFFEEAGKVYVYDFETNQQHIAIDDNLQPGDTFTTINGEEWEVQASSDTLVCGNYATKSYEKWSKILKVVNKVDGRNDTWLEGFGSLSNHFMLEKPQEGTRSETLWILNGYYYITRELSADPIYGHDTGWKEGTYVHGIEGDLTNTITYKPDTLTITTQEKWKYPCRHYMCLLRKGDEIFYKGTWEFLPHVDSYEEKFVEDTITLHGLPEPVSGTYTVHIPGVGPVTGIDPICNERRATDHSIYDIQGQRLPAKPRYGIYIQDGRKKIAE